MKRNLRKKVFIVDDSPVVRERLATLLSDLPSAEIAFEAISATRRLKPDVMLLDISMPGGSGIHVLEMVKKERPAPLVIMLTNFAHEQYRQKCLQLGADFFFDKSTEFEKVLHVLNPVNEAAEPSPS